MKTLVPSSKVTSPSKRADVSSHHAPCSGRSLFLRADSSESNRASVIDVPSSVTPETGERAQALIQAVLSGDQLL